jgi:hypothetical protein
MDRQRREKNSIHVPPTVVMFRQQQPCSANSSHVPSTAAMFRQQQPCSVNSSHSAHRCDGRMAGAIVIEMLL